MVIAFLHFFAMWYLAGVSSRLVAMKWPDSFIGRALIYAQ